MRSSRKASLISGYFLIVLVCLGDASLAASQTKDGTFDDLASQAAAAREQGDVARAVDFYTKAVQANSKWSEGWWFLGLLQYQEGAYSPAEDAFTHYLELNPGAGPALALRGLCEYESAAFPQAATDIQKAISLGAANDPHNAQILRYHEALALSRSGQFQQALTAYAFFAEKNITNPELLVAIGLAGLRMALPPKEVSAEQQPLVAAVGSAGFQFMSGDEKGAQKAFEKLFARYPNTANLHFFYGHLLFNSDPDAALAEFEHELKISPSNSNAAIMSAWILLLRNRPAEALPFAQKAVEQEPQSGAAELVLGRALIETGDLNNGTEILQKAVQQDPDNLEVHIALAKAFSKLGRKDDARRERMLCLQLTQGNAALSASP